MRRLPCFAICSCAAVLAGCAKSDTRAATDTSAVTPAVPPTSTAAAATAAMPAGMAALSDQAGTWKGHSLLMNKDSVVATWTLIATRDTTGWTLTFPGAKPIPVHVVVVAADSVVTEMGPYASPQRKGQMMTTRSVSRIQGGKRVGTYEARLVSHPDSVLHGRIEATRAP